MKTVAHVVTCLQIGGLERVVVNLVRGFTGQPYRQLVVCLETGGPFAHEAEQLGAKVIVLGKQPGMSWPAIRQLAKLFRQENVQIVHTHNPAPHFHGVLAGVLAGVPVRVHTKHGRNYPHVKKAVLLNRWLSWLTDAIVPVSDNARDVALQVEKINPHKVLRIWNGVDVGLYKPVESRDLRVERHNPRTLTIGTVARLSTEKDQTTMLAAFKIVLETWDKRFTVHAPCNHAATPACSDGEATECRNYNSASSLTSDLRPLTSDLPRLVFVGDGPCMEELRNDANRLGIAEQVDFLGARSDIASLLPTFSLFTLSSTTEGISMTILEAMACGLPIVATNVGGNREIVQPPTCGLIVPARDPKTLASAYLDLLLDPARRLAMGCTARQRVISHFSLAAMVQEYQRLYERLLHTKGVVA